MKKILLVISNNVLNGTERYVVDLAQRLSKEKFEVTVATPEYGRLSEVLKENSIREFIFNNRILDKFTLTGAKNLYRFIKENGIDIVHANSGVIPCIAGKLAGAKLCIETKHGLFFSDKQLESLTFRQKFHEKIKEYCVDFFVAISDNDKVKLNKYFWISEKKIAVIYNGIDFDKLKEYRKKKEFLPEGKILIGNIGRLTYQKGQDILIKSFKKLSKEIPKAELIIFGEGENKLMLKRLIGENKLEAEAKIENYKKDIFRYFSDFDIFVLTSRFEGVPYVLLEAMNLGIPVVSTNVGGIDKVIKNNVNGILTSIDDVNSTYEAMKRLIENRNLYEQIRENALEAVQKFDLNNMVKKYESFYLSNIH